MRFGDLRDRLFRKKSRTVANEVTCSRPTAASAEELFARMADVDYELYGRGATHESELAPKKT
jgi:hypothetical protein